MLERIVTKFTSVRTLIALMFTITACYLTVVDKVQPEMFMTSVGMVVAFYFAKERKV